jgi:flagellin
MSFSINTNIASLQATNYLTANQRFQNKTINEVTSGLRIVNSGDDAAGLAVANQYASESAVLTQGIQNANDGLATLQTIDGGMSNISQLLNRASTLATQSASGTFQGSRAVLNNEFQSVLTEINRQAQSIGMNSGGAFAKSLSVFIGGGRDVAGVQNNTSANTNGSVTVDLGNSAVDTQSLGLSSYSTAANGATALATITAGTTAGNVDLTFYGAGAAGFESGITVTAAGVNNASSLSDVVNAINAGISTTANTAGAPNAAFAAENIQAQLNSNGTGIIFTSANGAFAVSDGTNGKAAAANILGVATQNAIFASGTQQVSLTNTTDIGGTDTQDLTFTAVDASGTLHQTVVTLAAGTKANQVTAINGALQSAGGPLANIVAVDADGADPGAITLTGTANFTVSVGTATTSGDGLTSGGSQGVNASSALQGSAGGLDISTSGDAGLAITAIGNAVANLGTAQAVVGKGENNFTYAINLAQSEATNQTTSESSIRDANMAIEAANLTKAQILLQAGVAALAQANAAPQNILTLLKG